MNNLKSLAEIEKEHIRHVVSVVGSKSKAAEILGIDRRTLYRKIKEIEGYNSSKKHYDDEESE